jgi:formate dehydrogenase subunit beta
MNKIIEFSKKLLSDGTINVLIGYQKNSRNDIKPIFITDANNSDKIVFDENCTQNLVAYLHKPEIKDFKKIGILLNIFSLRAYLQLIAENQFKNLEIVPIIVHKDGSPEILQSIEIIEKYIKSNYSKSNLQEIEKINEIMSLDPKARWDYWVDAVKDCIKCYACRSACPMCYCDKCATDCNQPQWVATSSHVLGNVEWHIMRAMHLGGRCVNCNECVRSCPMDIPLNLLTRRLNEEIEGQFGQTSGMSSKTDYAFNSYKFEDKENFIR